MYTRAVVQPRRPHRCVRALLFSHAVHIDVRSCCVRCFTLIFPKTYTVFARKVCKWTPTLIHIEVPWYRERFRGQFKRAPPHIDHTLTCYNYVGALNPNISTRAQRNCVDVPPRRPHRCVRASLTPYERTSMCTRAFVQPRCPHRCVRAPLFSHAGTHRCRRRGWTHACVHLDVGGVAEQRRAYTSMWTVRLNNGARIHRCTRRGWTSTPRHIDVDGAVEQHDVCGRCGGQQR